MLVRPVWLPVVALAGLARASAVGGCPSFNGRQCAGHGQCIEAAGGPMCDCEAGYSHTDCSYSTYCPSDCSGRGNCVLPSEAVKLRDPLAPGTCACFEGFAGATCAIAVSTSPPPRGCDSWCSGHGLCSCGKARRVNATRVVRVFDSRGRAAQDAVVTEEVAVRRHPCRHLA